MSNFKKTIGLEIHAQMATKKKLFSNSLNSSSHEANLNVDFLDAGMPGALPVLNYEAVIIALRTSLALNMKINDISIFDRKHYFYADSPLGYQITQFYKPIGFDGYLDCSFGRVRINRLHMECDAGKIIHADEDSLVDLNRAGVPLMEIVTDPNFSSADQVIEFLKELQAILLTIESSNCDMEKGNFRVDVNISISENDTLGTRVEIKNLNSFRFINKAIDFEMKRQIQIIESGNVVIQQTRLFDTKDGQTKAMREKEDAVDYMYFPDPDLLPLKLDISLIEQTQKNLPKLPQILREEWSEFGVAYEQAVVLSEHPIRSKFFNDMLEILGSSLAKKISNWIVSELIGQLAKVDLNLNDFLSTRENFIHNFADIIKLCEDSEITRSNAKEMLEKLIESDFNVKEFANELGYLSKVSKEEIVAELNRLIAQFPSEVEKYRKGKDAVLMFFVGSVKKTFSGKCNLDEVKSILLDILKNENENKG
jgi:aspartyl-tRNA(Asn)/glutamyl-tRNA(Gln) amidotransferase subunit B